MEKDLIEKIDILKPDLDLPKELPEMHKEKKLVRALCGRGGGRGGGVG